MIITESILQYLTKSRYLLLQKDFDIKLGYVYIMAYQGILVHFILIYKEFYGKLIMLWVENSFQNCIISPHHMKWAQKAPCVAVTDLPVL